MGGKSGVGYRVPGFEGRIGKTLSSSASSAPLRLIFPPPTIHKPLATIHSPSFTACAQKTSYICITVVVHNFELTRVRNSYTSLRRRYARRSEDEHGHIDGQGIHVALPVSGCAHVHGSLRGIPLGSYGLRGCMAIAEPHTISRALSARYQSDGYQHVRPYLLIGNDGNGSAGGALQG